MTQEIRVPELGDFSAVEVIEVLVSAGDDVQQETALIVLESDKATMEVPSPLAGRLSEILVQVGDRVSQGDVIARVEESVSPARSAENTSTQAAPAAAQQAASDQAEFDCDVAVIGSGPGGYTAAFRAADLGLKTVLIEKHERLGGVCLNVGCIPSKALLHTAHMIDEAAAMQAHGVSFSQPTIDLDKLRDFKQSVVNKLTGGLETLAKQRKVTHIQGVAHFKNSHTLVIQGGQQQREIRCRHIIIATGSKPVRLPDMPWNDKRLMDSTGALELADIPQRMLVIGGGIIGLEMANVYAALGAEVDVVELSPQLIPGADKDVLRPLQKRMQQRLQNIYLQVRVSAIEAEAEGLKVSFEGEQAPPEQLYDKVLVAVGRRPNTEGLKLEAAGLQPDDRGFLSVDQQMRTQEPHIFAIGDVVGQPMLAHKASHEAKVAAEVIAGEKSAFDARCIPSVVYTDPELAWVGLTEQQAKDQGIELEKGQFPWAANGRSLGMGYQDGLTKLLFEKSSGRIVGGAAVGPNAGELIAEMALAIEFGADAHDIGLTIHAHPTLSESVGMAAEAAAGTLTDLYLPKKRV